MDYGKFSKIEHAVKACDSNSRCWGIFDTKCHPDGGFSSSFNLCPFGSRTFDVYGEYGCSYFKAGSQDYIFYMIIKIV